MKLGDLIKSLVTGVTQWNAVIASWSTGGEHCEAVSI